MQQPELVREIVLGQLRIETAAALSVSAGRS